jgi:acyl transferase domain-containing protein/NADPH:quinone reductase-like Zn-dependent oxidoreductase/NAD(P)-dependent dehydrogenase (short-subunit alcohol dehydrogenase family)/acyl carrier protein
MSEGPIAIVGASCRFPGAEDLEGFWRLLDSGKDAVSEVDPQRWSTKFFYHPDRNEPGKSYTWAAGLIDGFDLFEPSFFGISPREAAQMDPQQRLLLELVWHALEDAGIPTRRISGSTTGVYIGASTTDYFDLRLGDPASADSYSMTGNTLSVFANRISYVFDLRGPSLTIDTACSSSLVALHHACEAILSKRVATAIVGGVNLLLAPYPYLGFCSASMLSRRGRCFAFDERADGYVRGEGGGVVILRPLEDALADGDTVRAVILGTGVNSDGRTIGLSLPSEAAQASLLRSVYARAGVAPEQLAFFEMHGTGTPAGDPIEAAAVGHSLGQGRSHPLPIGSVKTNIGHLEPASGMAGLLKAALALDRGILPATLHCETPNPNIAFDKLNLRLVRDTESIDAARERRCAGVNSFGFGGTNAHVVLAAAPSVDHAASLPQAMPPLVISARSEASLRELVRSWHSTLAKTPVEQAPMLVRAAARKRDHHAHRLVALGKDQAATAEMLASFLDGAPAPGVITETGVREDKLAFVFSGNGAQFPTMGRDALRTNAAFRAAVEEVDGLLRPELGWSVTELLESGVSGDRLVRADVAQPLLFAVQVGIVRALEAIGVRAAAFFGHSVGEIAAAWGSGALSLSHAGRVVVVRSRHQQQTQGTGRMVAVAITHDAARAILAELDSSAEIAAVNAVRSVTISGSIEEIRLLEAELQHRDIGFRSLDLDFAFHSRAMDPFREHLLADLSGLASRRPESRLVSTVTGDVIAAAGALDAEYWWRNVRSPVRFTDAVDHLIGEGHQIFLEVGPRAILQSYLTDGLRSAEVQGRVLGSLSREQDDADPFPAIAARCHAAGYDWTSSRSFDGPSDPHGVPLYPWTRERFWFAATTEATDLVGAPFDHPLLGFRQRGATAAWLNHLDEQVLPWIADHAVEGVPVLPAAAILEMALATARWRWPDAPALEVFDVELRRPMPFDKARMRELRTVLQSDEGDWELASRPRLSSEPLAVYAVARVSVAAASQQMISWSGGAAARRRIESDSLYRHAHFAGLDYGRRFRTVSHVEIVDSHSAIAYLDPSPVYGDRDAYLLHPALLDGALQGLFGMLADRESQTQGVGFLPWRFGRVRLTAPFGRVPRLARLQLTRIGVRSISADIVLCDDAGDIVSELADCWFRRVELTRRRPVDERTLRVDLVPVPLSKTDPPRELADFSATLSRLAATREPSGRAQEQALLLDALIGSVAVRSFGKLVEPGRRFSMSQLTKSGQIAPDSVGIAESLLQLLERLGIASKAESEWCIEPSHDLPDAPEVWRLLLSDAPDLVPELALVAAAVEDLPRIFAEGVKRAETQLSPMAEQLLHGSPAIVPRIELLCDALAQLATAWPKARPMRVLEIGAIGGGATRHVLNCLARTGVALTYTAASADSEHVTRLSSLAKSYDGVSAHRWSPGDGNESLNGAAYDVVLAINACARLRLDAGSLANLHDLLVPGGIFVAIEAEPNALWDVIFGQSASWWEPESRAYYSSPLRSAKDWRDELVAAGFESLGIMPASPAAWPSALLCGCVPLRSKPRLDNPLRPTSATLVSGDATFRAALQDCLAEVGYGVALARSSDFYAACAVDSAPRSDDESQIVLFLAEEPGDGDPIDQASRQLAELARVATIAAERDAALWVVTCEAQQTTLAHRAFSPVGSALWGLGRVLVNEMPRLSVCLVDLPGAVAPSKRAQLVAAELLAATAESEVVWTSRGRHVPRLRRGLPTRWAMASDMLSVGAVPIGGLDALGWEARTPRPVAAGQVEIDVYASGLNFRDVMWAMGLLPEEALSDGFAGPTLGLECAGIVRSLGPGVDHLAVGDRVMAFAPGSLSTRVVTIAEAVAPIPPEVSFPEAATIPVTFVTAIYALGRLAKLAPGEHVLIHTASGGVGLAAIQYAKQCGAVVIATAGSEVKRAFLRLAGADCVLDSRDLAFCDAVREFTGGQGVDIVLNSLSGEAMERSIEVLKPFGRFLELGKRDFYLNRRIHLRPLRQNISYFAIDIDQLPVRRPDLARQMLTEVSEALFNREIRPLAHRIFSFGELEDAFRLMQSSAHIGKLVLVPDANAGVSLRKPPEITLRGDGTYLITGGVEGFGYECARWLVAHGAGSIALLSRRGSATPGCEARVKELEAAGAAVRVYQGDAADFGALAIILDAIRANQPPLRGVVHAASVIEDGFAADIDIARVGPIMHPKLGGAIALDALTRDDPIELFLLFSSATTLVGAPGQGVYVAANMALEALARKRQAEGRPALAVAWGPIEDTGYLAERPAILDSLARRLGARPIPAAQALAGLPAMIASALPAVAFADTNWAEARRFLPILATPLFADSRAKVSPSPVDESLAEQLASLDLEEALALLKTVVAEEAATILRLPVEGIDPLRPLSEMGMDSLMAVELRLALETRLRVDLPLVSLTEGTSIASVAARLSAAVSTGSTDAEVIALTAHHEVVEGLRPPADSDRVAAE